VILEYHAEDRAPRRDVLREPIRLEGGYLYLPEKPGPGVELNEEYACGRPLRNWHRGFARQQDGAPALI